MRQQLLDEEKKRREETQKVMQPTACQCCPLEMINGHEL